jgi:hypothetical protein
MLPSGRVDGSVGEREREREREGERRGWELGIDWHRPNSLDDFKHTPPYPL